MPLTRITTNFSLGERKAELAERLHNTLVEVVKTAEHARWIMVDEHTNGAFLTPEGCAGPHAIVELSFFPGRSLDTKRQLYKRIADLLADFGLDPQNTRVIIQEVGRESWGLRGGRAASDVELGFDPNV